MFLEAEVLRRGNKATFFFQFVSSSNCRVLSLVEMLAFHADSARTSDLPQIEQLHVSFLISSFSFPLCFRVVSLALLVHTHEMPSNHRHALRVHFRVDFSLMFARKQRELFPVHYSNEFYESLLTDDHKQHIIVTFNDRVCASCALCASLKPKSDHWRIDVASDGRQRNLQH
jgi:hypothetical protein